MAHNSYTELFRGSKSRNKVSVGEPAEGSLTNPSRCCLDVAPCAFVVCLICTPSALGLRVYISGKPLMPMV